MSKSDKELLELAIKAAGYTDIKHDAAGFYRVIGEHDDGLLCMVQWNPLTSDGDALRLAIDILADVCQFEKQVEVVAYHKEKVMAETLKILKSRDKYATTRLCIVMAAAAIGEAMA